VLVVTDVSKLMLFRKLTFLSSTRAS